MIREIYPTTRIRGEIVAPGDKSISHRAIMCNAIADGDARITNFLMGADCVGTIEAMRGLGVGIDVRDNEIIVRGKGLHSLTEPKRITNAGNSGTTARLMLGILAGQSFNSIVDGDTSLEARPMARVLTPLSMMGGRFLAKHDKYLPVNVFGSPLHGIEYEMPVASAQVKSALIFAGLYADGKTRIIEKMPSRNHTELMLRYMGANVTSNNGVIEVEGTDSIKSHNIYVQGDISSASYFIVAGLLARDSELLIKNVNINDTRAGILKVLERMGAYIRLENIREDIETMADIYVKSSSLHGTRIGGAEIPTLIDELPIISIAAMLAEGETVVENASELKVKETNRIDTICEMVSALGGNITATEDGFVVNGVESVAGGFVNSYGDHRIAMAGSIGSLLSRNGGHIVDSDSVDISFPEFFNILESISR